MNIKYIILSLMIGNIQLVHGGEGRQAENEAVALDYINALRGNAGMSAYVRNPLLERAALNHANYCNLNRSGGHYESENNAGFTGKDPSERIASVGYLSRGTGENVSFHKGGGAL